MRAMFFLPWLSLTTLALLSPTTFAAFSIAKPGCPSTCGHVSIPYPFGIDPDGACSLGQSYNLHCNTSYDPPKPFSGNMEVLSISINGEMQISNYIATRCYREGQSLNGSRHSTYINLTASPTVFSNSANKFTVIGCDDFAFSTDNEGHASGCVTTCTTLKDVSEYNGSCSGIGCCQTALPKGLKVFRTSLFSFYNHTNVSEFNPCGASFIVEDDKFTFNVADLEDNTKLVNKADGGFPILLDWFVGFNQTCHQALQSPSTSNYTCKRNTKCIDFEISSSESAYRCSCLPGYQGNPYLSPGCVDIDECAGPSNPCSHKCTNIPGDYICTCPKGHKGDGKKNGSQCHSQFVTRFSLGISFGFLILLVIASWVYIYIKKRKLMKKREIMFEKNGGILLTQQLIQNGGTIESSSKIFSVDELKSATNNFSENRILGKGGYGTVYKGYMKDGREVAVKKSKVADQTQVEQFINEVVILTQINHRNVVKLLGCCLETDVPLLVYEFISNGTLFEHIHKNKGTTSWLSWSNCMRLAAEAADALAYLHSTTSIPIIHRDVKSSNILLDESYTTKISDFGASRLVPIDQTQVTTLVQGTLGYLDPEYFHTSQLTEKSDVYSFGVVLAELLTREKPLCLDKKMEERNLATYFVISMKEDRLMEILDPQIVREAREEQLIAMAKLVKRCLNVRSEDRPTMKEVALELEGLRHQNRHPWANQSNEETTSLMDQQDLYPVMASIVAPSTSEFSGQYSTQIDIITEMNLPR